MYRMRCAIEHKGCWATVLGKAPQVKDLRFWSGLMLDRDRIMGSFVVRSTQPLDLTAYNSYPLDYVRIAEERVGDDHLYHVDYVVTDDTGSTTIRLLFDSGCVFDPPATVDQDYEFMNLLASSKEDLRKLKGRLRDHNRAFRVLSLKELSASEHQPTVGWARHLTPRQSEAVRVAFLRGFYNYPRKTRLVDLAQEVGLSRSTFQEHLRLAEVKLIHHLLQKERDSGGAAP